MEHTVRTTSEMAGIDLEFWGDIAPVKQTIFWNNQEWKIEYELLDGDQDLDLTRAVAKCPEEERVIMEGHLRLATALRAINGVSVRETYPTTDAVMAWLQKKKGPLLDALLVGYEYAVRQPLTNLQGMAADPNFVGALSWSGVALSDAPDSTDED